jgi:hypothetical protein
MSSGIFVQFFKCEILMLGKFVSFIASCTFCIAEIESVEAEGVSDLQAGGHQVDKPHGQQPTGLGITERMTTVLNISGIG